MGSRLETTRSELGLAWREHRRYAGLAAVLMAVGVVIGALMRGRIDYYDVIGQTPEEIFPETITPASIAINNTIAFVALVVGILTLCLSTVFILVNNGIFIGYLLWPIAAQGHVLEIVVGIGPHGVFELWALFVAAAVPFRVLRLVVDRIRGAREQVLGREGWVRTGLLLVTAWATLLTAAFIEAYLTGWLLETLFG